jgi:hypothetical protein
MELLEQSALHPRQVRYQAALRPDIESTDFTAFSELNQGPVPKVSQNHAAVAKRPVRVAPERR